MIGTQVVPYWNGLGRMERTERYISIPMPWTRMVYDIGAGDLMVRARPHFSVYWYKPARTALVIRIGWSAKGLR